MVIVFYVSYNYGSDINATKEIAIGQEYRVKDILTTSNSSVMVTYYDNDKNMTEKIMVTTATNKFNVFKTNNTNISIMVLDRVENHVNYWKVYIPEKIIDNRIKEIGRKI